MTTIGDILKLKRFSSLKLINTNANLDREVSTIESTETPDISSFLAENSFLLTTGMVYKDNQKELSNLIIKLNNLPCAALGIKLGRFIDHLDDEVIETANRLNFPLIQIPVDVTLGTIFHQLLSYIWSNQNEQLLYALNTQKKFSNLMYKGASIQVLIRNLSNQIGRPIALIDPFGNIRASTEKVLNQYSKESIRTIIQNIPKIIDNKSTNESLLNNKNESVTISIYPVNFTSDCPFYLIVFHSDKLEFPLSEMAIEQATLILAFTLYKNLRIPYKDLSKKEELLFDIVKTDKYKGMSKHELNNIGSKYGIKSANTYRIVIAYTKDQGLNRKVNYSEELYSILFEWIDKKKEKNFNNSILFPDRKRFRFIFLLLDDVENLEDNLIKYKTTISNTLNLDINYAIGNEVFEFDSIKYSYSEALEAIRDGESKNGIDFIYYYKPLGTTELLKQIPAEQLELYCKYTLKSLANPDSEAQVDLRNTLKAYLDYNNDITKTANELFVHRNTVKYRIKKCENILEHDILDPEFSLKLRIALRLTENNYFDLK